MKNLIEERYEKLDSNYRGLKPRDSGGIYLTAFILMYIVLALIVVVSVIAKVDLNKDNTATTVINNLTMIFTQFAFVLAPLMYCKATNKTEAIRGIKLKRGISVQQGLLCLAIGVLIVITFYPIAEGFIQFLKWTGYEYELSISSSQSVGMLFLNLFVVGLLPAIGEEFLFRGFIARGLKARSYVFAMVMTGFMFSIFHGNALQLVHQFLGGMIMTFVYLASGSIYTSMIVHFVNNVVALVTDFVLLKCVGTAVQSMSVGMACAIYIPMILVGGALLYLCLRAFIRATKQRQGKQVGKINVKAFFTDFAQAFYPSGIERNYKNMNATMKELFDDPCDDIVEVEEVKTYGDVDNEKMRKLLIESDAQDKRKSKIRDRNILLLALALVGVVWILNFAAAYL